MLLFPLQARVRALLPVAALAALAAPVAFGATFVPCTTARAQTPEVRVFRTPMMERRTPPVADRAVLGVLLAPGSRADTAGVRLETVDANSPAAKAGLKAGDVVTDINDTSLRVAKEDAEDLALAGLAQRRLQRVLGKAKSGDEVTLRVRTSGAAPRTVTVKTTSQAELDRAMAATNQDDGRVVERTIVRRTRGDSASPRGMVGLTIGSAGNARDTLGLFVSSVVGGGPAEKAGIVEGERVATVNGVDVRLPKEDVDDAQAVSARIDRFVREVQRAEPGKTVTLRVYGGGRYREVAVTAARASDLPMGGFSMSVGDGGLQILTPRAPRTPTPPQLFEFERDGDIGRLRLNGQELRIDTNRLRESVEEMRRHIEEGVRNGMRGLEMRDAPVRGRRAVVIL